MAAHARDALLGLAAGRSLLAREAIQRRCKEIETELAGTRPSALEKLLAERASICWLQCYLSDLDAVQKDRADTLRAYHAQRRQTAAQARYLGAFKQLAVIRKLLTPARATLDLLRYLVDEHAETRARSAVYRPRRVRCSGATSWTSR